ncbi:MAG: 3-keto-5-aminohexanoate cleavage protein [Thermoleophilia bacterium]
MRRPSSRPARRPSTCTSTTGRGDRTLAPGPVGEALAAIRAAAPGLPVGLSTAAGQVGAAAAALAAWDVLPEFVSVNLEEPGAPGLAALARERGVAVEAGLWTVEDARALVASGLAPTCLRVLVEPREREDAAAACAVAAGIEDVLAAAGIATPQLHHGKGAATWAVVERALARGHQVRIGLEDVQAHADGRPAQGNRDLVEAAVARARLNGTTTGGNA